MTETDPSTSDPESKIEALKAKLHSLTTTLTVGIVVVGVIPLVLVGVFSYNRAAGALASAAGNRLEVAALQASETIDRDLHGHYDDTFTFAANPRAWGSPDETADLVDQVVTSYEVYDLVMIVDRRGKVEAVNSVDHEGQPINSFSLTGRPVSDQPWFLAVTEQEFEGKVHTTDATVNNLVDLSYGDARPTIGFTSPIHNDAGALVGYWHSEVSVARTVSEILDEVRHELHQAGVETGETQAIRSDGVILHDDDPSLRMTLHSGNDATEATARAIAGDGGHGSIQERDEVQGTDQVVGYASSDGAGDFAGYGWGVLLHQDMSEVTATATSIRNLSMLATVLAGITIASCGYWFARRTAKPVTQVADHAWEIATGHLDVEPLELERQDEIGHLADAFNEMTSMLRLVNGQAQAIAERRLSASILQEKAPGQLGEALESMTASLSDLVGQIQASSGQLAQAAGQLSALSSEVGDSAKQTSADAKTASLTGDEVSANVATVAAAIEEMHASIREIARSAASASEVASEAVGVARESSMSIAKLGDSSQEIGEVIKVINSIAEQTNLLALNATIEAARAGEAGKGFAVVANEVKDLANQTAQATEEISTRIQTIQADTTGTVEASRRIGETIDRISDISVTIASAVEQQSATTDEIGRGVDQAAQGSATIADRINQVATAAEGTRFSINETQSSVAELAKMAGDLKELVDEFT